MNREHVSRAVHRKALAMWRNKRSGSVLFLAEPTAGRVPFEYRSLHHEDARLLPIRPGSERAVEQAASMSPSTS